MNTFEQILSGIRQVLGITSTVRSTATTINRESKNVSAFIRNKKEKKNKDNKPDKNA